MGPEGRQKGKLLGEEILIRIFNVWQLPVYSSSSEKRSMGITTHDYDFT